MKQAAAIPARVSSLNVTVVAASLNTGLVMATMIVETTVMRLMQTVPIRVRNNMVYSTSLKCHCSKNCCCNVSFSLISVHMEILFSFLPDAPASYCVLYFMLLFAAVGSLS